MDEKNNKMLGIIGAITGSSIGTKIPYRSIKPLPEIEIDNNYLPSRLILQKRKKKKFNKGFSLGSYKFKSK